MAYSELRSWKGYSWVRLDIRMYPQHRHHSQDNEPFRLPQEFSLAHSCLFLSLVPSCPPPLPQATTDLPSVTADYLALSGVSCNGVVQ